jgi:hypothetical protein
MLVVEETRKLARIVEITDIRPIPKADRLEVAIVDGWECVVQKGMYKKGDVALYFEIDAAIALDNPVWNGFDTQYLKIVKDEASGKDYAVIRSLRLRGQLSQGLLVQGKSFPGSFLVKSDVGWNATKHLEVLKYVSPAEAKLFYSVADTLPADASTTKKLVWRLRNWLMKGIVADGLQPWPHGHIKSEEERVQNLPQVYQKMVDDDEEVELSLKLDGESATFYTDLDTGEVGAAQRNYSLRTEDIAYSGKQSLRVYLADWLRYIARKTAGGNCPFPKWKTKYHAQSVPLVAYFKRNAIDERIKAFNQQPSPLQFMAGKKLAIQGEMVGPDFNDNAEKVSTNTFFVYRAYANGNQVLTPEQTKTVAKYLQLEYIPLINERMKLPASISHILKMADGPSMMNRCDPREGVVAKSHKDSRSFKIISNAWLEKKGK